MGDIADLLSSGVIKHGTPMNRVDFQEPRAPDEQWAAKVQSPTIFEGLGIYLKVEVPKHHEITFGCFMLIGGSRSMDIRKIKIS